MKHIIEKINFIFFLILILLSNHFKVLYASELNKSDREICKLATSKTSSYGNVWVAIDGNYGKYVKEAFLRGLFCNTYSKASDKNICLMYINSSNKNNKFETFKWEREIKNRRIDCNQIDTKKWTNDYVCLMIDINSKFLKEAKRRGLKCTVKKQKETIIASKTKNTKSSLSSAELDKDKQKSIELQKKVDAEERKRKALEKEIAALKQEKRDLLKPKKQQPTKEIGSGFYVSKFRHIVTNQHVVNQCKKISVGDSMSAQIPADLIASDKRNDLAILQTVSMEMASADTKSFVQKLAVQIVPVLSGGLMRSEDVSGGEEILVAGYPLGNMVSDTIKVTKGIVSATKGMDNDVSQFEIDAVIRKGNSGGPIYDKRGNIVGVAVSRLNVNRTDTINFGIKGSTVKQFLSTHNVPTKWSNRQDKIDTKDIYKIASKQTVMIVCHH